MSKPDRAADVRADQEANVLWHTVLLTRPHGSHLSSSPWQVVVGIECCEVAVFTSHQSSHARSSVTSLSQKFEHRRGRVYAICRDDQCVTRDVRCIIDVVYRTGRGLESSLASGVL
jgi:rhamnogalacturonyl hydrolase YesR